MNVEEKKQSGWDKFMDKLVARWSLKSRWQILIILIVFSLAGQSIMYARKGLWYLFDLEPINFWYKVLIWLLVLFPMYHLCFMFWGFVLGQWKFTWWFEKKMLRRFGIKL